MARKKQTRKSKKATLPKGFQAIGGFASSWPDEKTKTGDTIQGEVTSYDEIPVMRKGKKVMVELLRLAGTDGRDYTVWQSAGLRVLFEEDYTGINIFLEYLGLGPKKRGQNPPKLFNIAADLDE